MAKKALTKPAAAAVSKFSEGFSDYLGRLGLPVDGVLVATDERGKVLTNAPDLVDLIDPGERADAMYVSKFIAACGAGLFDAALNFIWDEVVVRLRDRVARFDLAYFFDTAVSAAERQHYQTEDDLRSLSDAALIKGALKCGMLTDIGFRHLDYIREMRNWASAAHPNHAEITGFQLVSWFETCLKEVILREPEGEVLEVGRLLRNLREQDIDAEDVPAISVSLGRLPSPLIPPLVRSVVGLYCDPRQDVRVRDNIKLIAADIWTIASDVTRGEIGIKHANFAANGDVDRKRLTHEFLELVGGLSYLHESDLALEIQMRVDQLEQVHDSWDNFFNEPPVARQLRKYIPDTGKIPPQVNDEYVRVLIRCRVGRTTGVSHAAVPIYDEMIDLFEEAQIKAFVRTLGTAEVQARLRNNACVARLRDLVTRFQQKAVTQPLSRALAEIAGASAAQLPTIWNATRFRRLVANL